MKRVTYPVYGSGREVVLSDGTRGKVKSLQILGGNGVIYSIELDETGEIRQCGPEDVKPVIERVFGEASVEMDIEYDRDDH